MFNLGWASHFVQDLTVVNHTYDAFMPWTHHNDYEDSANGRGEEFRPVANGEQYGIYADDLEREDCGAASRNAFPLCAAHSSHDADRKAAVWGEDYSSVADAIRVAQALQAGLYAAFLTDVGQPPVHMSAVMASL